MLTKHSVSAKWRILHFSPRSLERSPPSSRVPPHIIQLINQLVLPVTIDAAVYLDLQRVLNVFGATSTWTFAAMDGAAARGRLKLVKWLDETRSEGCSAAAFNQAASNNHLRVLHWLCKRHHFKCNATEAAVCAAVAGHLNVIKHLRAQSFPMDLRIALEAAAINEQIQVVEYLLTIPDLETHLALTAASKNGLTQVMRFLLGGIRRFDNVTLHESRAVEYAAAAGHVDTLAFLLECCHGHYGNLCTRPALRKAAEVGQMAAVVMLAPRCEGPAVGEALGVAIANGHEDMAAFLFRQCPAAEMAPAVVAAADKDLLELLERILAKCGSNVGLEAGARTEICSCFRSAASRGSEQIAVLLVGTLLFPWESPIQWTICFVLEDAASHSKYGLVTGFLDTFKLRQLCYPFTFADSVFSKAHNDLEMVELLTKYSAEGVVELRSREKLKKKQRTC